MNNNTPPLIRRATQADAKEIADIYRHYVEHTTISFETIAPDSLEISKRITSFTNRDLPYIVAQHKGHIVGYAYAHPWKQRQAYNQTWETSIYLAKTFEHHGIGTLLMHTLIDEAKRLGCHALIACITSENTRSRTFHETLGFKQVSEFHQVGYKQGRYLNVTDYELLLPTIASEIETKMISLGNKNQAQQLSRYFKCGKGGYDEGDEFIGLRVPQTRSIVKQFCKKAKLTDATHLIQSPWHEIRLAGFLLMIEIYNHEKRKNEHQTKQIINTYLASLHKANNWDLIDLTAPYLLGDWLISHPNEISILHQLSDMHHHLWHQRAAIVATWMLIRNSTYSPTLHIAEKYLTHSHDLIHKATGWMLREIGKRGGATELYKFLDRHAAEMPRTMLRYAIEKLSYDERQHYLHAYHSDH